MINCKILKSNVEIMMKKRGWNQERFKLYMGWGGATTYLRKFSEDGKWSFDEINRLTKWAGKGFEELSTKSLIN